MVIADIFHFAVVLLADEAFSIPWSDIIASSVLVIRIIFLDSVSVMLLMKFNDRCAWSVRFSASRS